MDNEYIIRYKCPCCGFPTISKRSNYYICLICRWEDDGQGDLDASIIKGGPNGRLSLCDARKNFIDHTIKYDSDDKYWIRDTQEIIVAKKRLMEAYKLCSFEGTNKEYVLINNTIVSLEKRLHELSYSNFLKVRAERIKNPHITNKE